MDYYLKYNKYKIKYINLKCNKSFQELDNILEKLDNYYSFFDKLTGQIGGGGGNIIKIDKQKINKYKKNIISAKKKIKKYKNMIKEYHDTYVYNNMYYTQIIQQLTIKKNELKIIYNNLENIDLINNNNKEKITMLENTISQLNKLIKVKTNLNLNIL